MLLGIALQIINQVVPNNHFEFGQELACCTALSEQCGEM